jgi:hypothetical protein
MALKTASGFTTGLAQPKQPQSQGTPYNPQQGSNFGAWAPAPAQSQGTPSNPQQGQPFGAWAPTPGSTAASGPIPGTTVWRPPMNAAAPQPAAPASGKPQRAPVTQAPAPRPTGISQNEVMQRQFGDFWGQAQQMFPTMSPVQQQEMAQWLKSQQEANNQRTLDQAREHGMQQWHADQAAAGQNIKAAPAATTAPRPTIASRPAAPPPPASAGPQAASITGQPEPGKKGTPPRGGPAQSATAGPDLGAWYDKMVSDGRPPAAAGALASQASYYAKNWHMSDNEREMYWQLVQGGTRPSDAVGQAREYYRRRPA